MRIFEIDLIREKITDKLSNSDASNLMTALKPTNDWELFFNDKKRKDRDIYCPLCMLNIMVPPIDPFGYVGEDLDGDEMDWTYPINNLRYAYPFIVDLKVYEEENDAVTAQSHLIIKESSNLHRHKNRLAITPNSSENAIKEYCDKINFENIPKFSTEDVLLKHIKEVRTFFKNSFVHVFLLAPLF